MNPVVSPACSGAVEVRASSVHGEGVFALRSLPPGLLVGRYEGRRYAPSQARERHWDGSLTYLFGLSDGTLIDATEGGNATRLINHSCEPNCVAIEEADDEGDLQIVFRTKRRIRVGEELFIDYRLDVGTEDPAAYRCRCGSPRCRGTLAARALLRAPA